MKELVQQILAEKRAEALALAATKKINPIKLTDEYLDHLADEAKERRSK